MSRNWATLRSKGHTRHLRWSAFTTSSCAQASAASCRARSSTSSTHASPTLGRSLGPRNRVQRAAAFVLLPEGRSRLALLADLLGLFEIGLLLPFLLLLPAPQGVRFQQQFLLRHVHGMGRRERLLKPAARGLRGRPTVHLDEGFQGV